MTQEEAKWVCTAIGGEMEPGGEGTDHEGGWIVTFARADGRFVVLTSKAVDEYFDRDAFEKGQCYASISLV